MRCSRSGFLLPPCNDFPWPKCNWNPCLLSPSLTLYPLRHTGCNWWKTTVCFLLSTFFVLSLLWVLSWIRPYFLALWQVQLLDARMGKHFWPNAFLTGWLWQWPSPHVSGIREGIPHRSVLQKQPLWTQNARYVALLWKYPPPWSIPAIASCSSRPPWGINRLSISELRGQFTVSKLSALSQLNILCHVLFVCSLST